MEGSPIFREESFARMIEPCLRSSDVGFTRIGNDLSLFHIIFFPANSMARNGGCEYAKLLWEEYRQVRRDFGVNELVNL